MVYRAQVIDNTSFIYTGKIRVRVYKYYYGEYDKYKRLPDLSKKPEKILEGLKYDKAKGQFVHKDIDVKVFSPIGGGDDYGMFFLPQVNTNGIVLMLGDTFEQSGEFIWLGSIFEMFNNTIKMPSDDLFTQNGIESGSKNIEVLDGALILKLRSTKLKNPTVPSESKEYLNWKTSPIENLIVINKNKITINHAITSNRKTFGHTLITLDGESSSFSFDKNGITGEAGLDTSGSFFLNINTETGYSSVIGTDKGISLESGNDKSTSFIYQYPDKISLFIDNSSINMTPDTIHLKSKSAIYIDAENVNLGPSGKKVVLSDTELLSFDTGTGAILSTSSVISG